MIDCHLHLQDPRLAGEVGGILATLRSLGITRLVVNGTHPGDWDSVEQLAADVPEVIPNFGLHPWRVGTEGADWLDDLSTRLARHPAAGLGEIGLDRWVRGLDFGRQQDAFRWQLDLARRFGRPVTIHCLRAWGRLRELLTKHHPGTGLLLHSYGGPAELVGEFASIGAYFSLSGYFFREGKEAKLATFDQVPHDRLLIETDAPDMAPPPGLLRYRLADASPDDPEAPNHPANLVPIYEAVASRQGISLEETIARMRRNFEAWQGGRSR